MREKTLMRQWETLRLLPRSPGSISVLEVVSRLKAEGYATNKRTIQRDLMDLSKPFPITCSETRPKRWCWMKGKGIFGLAGLDVHTALTLNLVETVIRRRLPSSIIRNLQPAFDQAKKVMKAAPARLSSWRDRVLSFDDPIQLLPPEIDDALRETIYEGLLDGRQIEVTYNSISSDAPPKSYPVNPIALVVQEQTIHLVCTVKEYKDPRLLALHRICKATLLSNSARPAEKLDIRKIASNALSINLSEHKISLRILVSPLIGKYLTESRLSADQKLENQADGWSEVRASVNDSMKLRRWLRSLGADVIVIEPKLLQKEIIEDDKKVMTQYAQLID